jgi:hypothetical protein
MERFSFFDWVKKDVLAVIVILMGIVGISFYQLQIGGMKARDAQRKADVELVARALEKYFYDYQIYPTANDGKIVACGKQGLGACDWGTGPIVDRDNVVYLKDIPIDPKTWDGWSYEYVPDKGGQNFRIYVGLEYRSDQAFRKDLTVKCGNNVQCSWYVEN